MKPQVHIQASDSIFDQRSWATDKLILICIKYLTVFIFIINTLFRHFQIVTVVIRTDKLNISLKLSRSPCFVRINYLRTKKTIIGLPSNY